jgi:uncharacterized membrane protein
MTADPADTPPVFEASIVPYRSLQPKGVAALLGVFTLFVSLIAARFWWLGAWPVVLFGALEVPLVVVLLWLNMRSRRANEMILMTSRHVTVTRTDSMGRRETFSMPTAWLRVDQEMTNGASRLMLRSHGAAQEVGSFLHETDRESLCQALRDAVRAVHNPRFDNPQLRDG